MISSMCQLLGFVAKLSVHSVHSGQFRFSYKSYVRPHYTDTTSVYRTFKRHSGLVLCLVHTTDKTRLSCWCRRCEQNCDRLQQFSVVLKLETGLRQDKTLFRPHFETEQNCKNYWICLDLKSSVADSFDLSPVLFTPSSTSDYRKLKKQRRPLASSEVSRCNMLECQSYLP